MNTDRIVFRVIRRTHLRASASTSGFTLIELLLVLAFFAIAVAMGTVLVRNQLLGSLDGDAQSVRSRLEEAQARSIAGSEGSAWGIYFNNASATPYYALFPGTSFVAASSTYSLSGFVEFQTPAAGTSTAITFSKLNGTTATTTSVVLRLRSSQQQIETVTVSAAGRITLTQ